MSTTTLTHHDRARTGALGVLAAVLAPLAVWVVAVPLFGVDLQVTTPTGAQSVGPVMIVASALVVALLGWALLAVLERRTRRAVPVWMTVAAIVLLISLVPPIISAVSAAGAFVLVVMHVAVAAALVPALRRGARR